MSVDLADVLPAAVVQRVKLWQLTLVCGDHEFAADLVRDAVLAAESDHLPDAGDGQASLG